MATVAICHRRHHWMRALVPIPLRHQGRPFTRCKSATVIQKGPARAIPSASLTLNCMTAHNSRLPQPADPVADRRHPALGLPKRAFDLAVSLVLLIILTPLMLLAAVLILATMGRPVFFKQERPGLHGRPFQLIKFRTMSNLRDPQGALLPDGQRLGRLGRFLRSTSIDELPELLNVFRGDMSLVGPRPLL